MKEYKFPLDGKKFSSKAMLFHHIEENYSHLLNEDITPARLYFNLKYKKTEGKCVMSGKPTLWNEKLQRYERFYSEVERTQYREQFKQRMVGKYGKVHLLDSPEKQKEMLNSRSIGKDYIWYDKSITKVTGEYEYDFLYYLEHVYSFTSKMLTEPPTIYYKDKEVLRFYIPDFYVPDLNLIIEVKGSNAHYQDRDEYKELLKKEATLKEGFNYIQINDRIYTPFNVYFKKEVIDK